MKTKILIFLGCLFSLNSTGQTNYKRLLDSAIAPGVVMFVKPLKTLYINKEDLWTYKVNIQEFKENVDTTVILEIIANSTQIDTTKWTYQETPNVILINTKEDKIPLKRLKSVLKKHPSPICELEKFNGLSPGKRNILSYSRPVFDKSRRYAAVAYNERNGYGTTIYHLKNSRWVELGFLVRWVY